MTEKLVKTGNDYILYSKDKTVLGITSGTMEGRMLSLKNCEAIDNGYDLDEIRKLADEDFECELGDGPTTNESINSMIKKSNANGAEWGFKKALEILSDKKFSEEDMRKSWSEGYHRKVDEINGSTLNYFDDLIQSLQQTEWDVEIVMECPQCKEYGYISECRNVCNKKFIQPKLDADGCLILRRI